MARILLAEPDRAIRDFIAGILTDCGHDVVVSENAVEASVWLATSRFDVLVTDMVLNPDHEALLSRSCAAFGVRTITLTGREFHADQSEATTLPALLEKPFRFSDLQQILDAVAAPPAAAAVCRETYSAA
jgi:two-component system cell cycle response regulator CpdR